MRNIEPSQKPEKTEDRFDAIVVGGSFAGLAAATQLARARRKVLVIDDGKPRNRFADHSHGFLTQDGKSPADILIVAHEQLAKYPTVRFLNSRAISAANSLSLLVRTEAGTHSARRVVLAYGMRDVLPEIEGIQELWGKTVFHCPYCHGYEVRDRSLAVLGNGAMALHQAMMLPDWSNDVILFTNGSATFDNAERARLARRGVKLEEMRVARLISKGEMLLAVELEDGRQVPREGLLTATNLEPVSDLHAQLGCAMEDGPLGAFIRTDDKKATSVPNVYAAGDIARPSHSVSFAVADGVMAGVMAHQSIIAEDWA